MSLLILIRGFPATGKSTLALAVAAALNAPLLVKDDVRAATLAQDNSTRTALRAAGADQSLVAVVDSNAACYHVLAALASTQFRAGAATVVVEGPLWMAGQVAPLVEDLEVRVLVVECSLERDAWLRRLGERERTGAHASVLAWDARAIEQHYDCERYVPVGAQVIEIDCGKSVEGNSERVVEAARGGIDRGPGPGVLL